MPHLIESIHRERWKVEVMAARLGRKTQILLGVKFEAELIFSVCTDDIAEVHLGGSAGSIAKSAAFVWKTCLPNVALLVKPAAPLRGKRSQRKSRRGCFTQQVLEMRMFQPRPRQHEAFWARLAGTKSRELSGDNPPPNPPTLKEQGFALSERPFHPGLPIHSGAPSRPFLPLGLFSSLCFLRHRLTRPWR